MDDSTDHELHLGPWLAGAALGAAVMYMLDPERGAPRRAQSARALRTLGQRTGTVVDKVAHGLGERAAGARGAVREAAADAATALRGAAADAAEALRGGAAAAREAVREGAGNASAALQGLAASAAEVPSAAKAAASTHQTTAAQTGGDGARSGGPDGAADQEQRAGASPALPGPAAVPAALRDTGRLAAGMGPGMRSAALAGGALGLYGLIARRSPLAFLAGLAGLALLASGARAAPRRSAAARPASPRGRPLRSLLAAANPARPVIVEKTIRIDAAPELVFDQFASYENFPRFMSNVVEVRDLGAGRSHWVVRGPAGTRFQWTARLTESTRPRRLAWESEPGAEVEQAGSIEFEPFRSGTRVTVHMSYRPPAGAVGHALASLLGSDPKRQMDDDLARMKSLVERGAARHAATGEAARGVFLH